MDGAELRLHHGADRGIVEAHHRQILRQAEPQTPGGFHDAGGQHIVKGEYGGGPIRAAQQTEGCLCGALDIPVAHQRAGFIHRKAVFPHNGEKRIVTGTGDIRGEAAHQHGDSLMSGRDQMADYLTHTAGFIRHNAGQIEARRPVVYQDHGDVLPLKFGNQVGLGIACQDDTLDLLALGRAGPFLRCGDQKLVVGAVGAAHDALADAGVKFIQDGRALFTDQEGDLVGLLPGHGPGYCAGLVMQCLRRGVDPAAGGFPHPVRCRKGSGDRGGGDAGQAGYIINRWGIHKTGSPFQCKKALTFMHNKDKAPSAVICAYDIMAKFGLQ